MIFRKSPPPPPPPVAIAERLLEAWDPRGTWGFDAACSILAEEIPSQELSIYRCDDDWLVLAWQKNFQDIKKPKRPKKPEVLGELDTEGLASEVTEKVVVDSDGGSAMASGGRASPRVRLQPHHKNPRHAKDPHPGSLSAPLFVGSEMIGMALVHLSENCDKDQAVDVLENAAKVLAAMLATSTTVSALQEAIASADRRTKADQTAMGATVSLDRLLETLLAQCARAIGHNSAILAQRSDEKIESIKAAWNVSSQIHSDAAQLNQALEVDVFDAQTVVVTVKEDGIDALGAASVLATPLQGAPYVLILLADATPRSTKPSDLNTLEAYANQIAVLVAREDHFSHFAEAYGQTLQTTVESIELSRPSLRGHHARVTQLACDWAQAAKLPADAQQALKHAAKLHDVGLMGGPDARIDTSLEFEHPELGASMVSLMPDGERIGQIIREHHETHDGFGFPDALSGDAISIEGQILAMAEFVVEQTTANAVVPAASLQEAALGLEQEAGERFRPDLVQIGAKSLRERSEVPFGAGACIGAKSCPEDVHKACLARTAQMPCWKVPAADRRCARHGDDDCEGCFVWNTWGPGSPNHKNRASKSQPETQSKSPAARGENLLNPDLQAHGER